ncbi:MAG: DUF4406 domain-containing protein [Phycisphaerales bacterium]|nr:MAG: DUF4406 domain-containing protein [Phycisphaerales bacterium]
MTDIPKRLYLAGPMSGMREYNFPLFNSVARQLRAQGHEVFNPAENKDGDTRQPRSFYMWLDIPALLESDAVVVLPGWEKSRGASLEVWLAIDLGLEVYYCTPSDGAVQMARLDGLEISCLPFSSAPVTASAADME